MWIRSQNKMILVEAKIIKGIDTDLSNKGKRRYKIDVDTVTEDYNIGIYETEEQVIQVLDMIQEHVENTHFDSLSCNYLTGDGNVQVPFQTAKAVFQMPAISEVEAMLSKEKEWTVEEILKREG